MNAYQKKIQSKVGPYYLIASARGLHGVFWQERDVPMLGNHRGPEAEVIAQAAEQLDEYLAGKRRDFDLPLDVEGTPFQKRVWAELAKIPYGETRSYRDIAIKLGDRNACRAVGTANGRNPISIIVPCHRVIAANGTMGGYAGGLNVKERLLALEAKSISA